MLDPSLLEVNTPFILALLFSALIIVGDLALPLRDQLRNKKRSSSTHEESQHTRGLTWFGRLPMSTGKGGVFSASSQKEVHDTMLLDLFYSPTVHESL